MPFQTLSNFSLTLLLKKPEKVSLGKVIPRLQNLERAMRILHYPR